MSKLKNSAFLFDTLPLSEAKKTGNMIPHKNPGSERNTVLPGFCDDGSEILPCAFVEMLVDLLREFHRCVVAHFLLAVIHGGGL